MHAAITDTLQMPAPREIGALAYVGAAACQEAGEGLSCRGGAWPVLVLLHVFQGFCEGPTQRRYGLCWRAVSQSLYAGQSPG